MITEIKEKIVGFKRDGTMVVFDSKKEQVDYDCKKKQVNLLFSSPRWILDKLRKSEDRIEELEEEAGIATGTIQK